MKIQSTQSKVHSLPKLPEVPERGTGTIVTEPIDFVTPKTVETRLGSIPRNFETGTGSSRSTRKIYFETDEKEAQNRYGRSKDIWRAQPVLDQADQVQMEEVSEPITVKYRNPLAEGLVKGAIGAGFGGFFGLWGGIMLGAFTGSSKIMLMGGLGGAALGGLGVGLSSYHDAASEKVKLEWVKTDINEHDLKGYTYRVDEDEDCTGTGTDRRCDSDYEHIYRPIIATTKHGEYYKPSVVRYKD